LDNLKQKVEEITSGNIRKGKQIELWDGHTADRIVMELRTLRDQWDLSE
jgi:hypothetical protein